MSAMPAIYVGNLERIARLAGSRIETMGKTAVVRPCSVEGARRVVAGAAADRIPLGADGIVIDRSGLSHVGLVDARAMWIHCGAGARVAEVEQALRRAGLTLGSQPPVVFEGTVAAWLEGPFAGRRAMDGRLEPGVASLQGVLSDGTPLETRPSPRSAAGPAIAHLLLGGGGRCGLVLGASLKARRLPGEEQLLLVEGESASLVALLLHCLRTHLPPLEAHFIGPGRLWLRFSAGREDERAALHQFRRVAHAARLVVGSGEAIPSAGGEAWEIEPRTLADVVPTLAADEQLQLHRLARESCIAVGRRRGAELPAHDDLFGRIAAALVP